MNCPKCSSRTGVYKTWDDDDGNHLRYRRCPNCQHKFITVEKALGVTVQGRGKHGGKRAKRSIGEE